MTTFAYTARDASGRSITGTLAAPNVGEVLQTLRAEGKYPVSVRPADQDSKLAVYMPRGGVKIPRADVIQLSTQLAIMLETYAEDHLSRMRDTERLLRIVNNYQRPVQIIFAGKAHPMDDPSKLLLQQVYRTLKRAEFGGRIVFLEDYDINLARYLVQGVDVWMNNPRRPLEASGTSGMKAALNGVINFSVLDGWWQEGYNGENGWAIGDETTLDDLEAQDARDAESLYTTLENQIVPLYYEAGFGEMSPGWMRKIKESISTLAPQFSTRRMVKQYLAQMYLPSVPERAHFNPGATLPQVGL